MKKLLCIFLILSVVFCAAACSENTPAGETQAAESAAPLSPLASQTEAEKKGLTVHFIDVGQGDATLLESDGEFVLIDAGERDKGDTVLDYLRRQGADELKYVIATHPHTDHIGGMKTVLYGVTADNFITVETDCATKTWLNVLETVDTLNINYIDAEVGDSYTFGSASFTILAPHSDSYSGYNNYSVAAKVTCGDIRFMLTGDAEKASEYEMAASGDDLSADVLKCGHHGSSTSTTAKFLRSVAPSYAVISCGEDNEYGHPHKETLQKLDIIGCQVYRTDTMGTVVAYTDGKDLRFETEKGGISSATYSSGETAAAGYVGNKNSHVFHLPSCGGVKSMNEKNKVIFSTREDAVNAGYTPCGSCNP